MAFPMRISVIMDEKKNTQRAEIQFNKCLLGSLCHVNSIYRMNMITIIIINISYHTSIDWIWRIHQVPLQFGIIFKMCPGANVPLTLFYPKSKIVLFDSSIIWWISESDILTLFDISCLHTFIAVLIGFRSIRIFLSKYV